MATLAKVDHHPRGLIFLGPFFLVLNFYILTVIGLDFHPPILFVFSVVGLFFFVMFRFGFHLVQS